MPGATLKSTRPGEVRSMREVTITSLHEFTGGNTDDMLLCPVRRLRRYDEVTATTREDGSALFSADQLCRIRAITYDQYGIGLD